MRRQSATLGRTNPASSAGSPLRPLHISKGSTVTSALSSACSLPQVRRTRTVVTATSASSVKYSGERMFSGASETLLSKGIAAKVRLYGRRKPSLLSMLTSTFSAASAPLLTTCSVEKRGTRAKYSAYP